MKITKIVLFVFLLLKGTFALAQMDRLELEKLGKEATALLRLTDSNETSAAFCIDAQAGIFLTNAYPIDKRAEAELILNPGLPNQELANATVLARKEEADLAVLKIKGPIPKLRKLELDIAPRVISPTNVLVFGFPSDASKAANNQWPNVDVTNTQLKGTRGGFGSAKRIGLRTTLAPTYAGGPVLNEQGKVVGIVVSGTKFQEFNYAISMEEARNLLRYPIVDIITPKHIPSSIVQPIEVAVNAGSYAGPIPDVRMELHRVQDGKISAKYPLGKVDKQFVGTIPPLDQADVDGFVPIKLVFEDGEIRGSAPDFDVAIGTTKVPIQQIRSIEFADSGQAQVTLPSGASHNIKLPRTGSIDMRLHQKKFAVPLDGVRLIQPRSRTFKLVVFWEGKEFAALDPWSASKPASAANASDLAANAASPADLSTNSPPTPAANAAPPANAANAPANAANGPWNANPRGNGHVASKIVKGVVSFPPPPFQQDTRTLKLDGPISNVFKGGGGRYLIIHIERNNKLEIFDCSTASLIGSIGLIDGPFLCTAGMKSVLITYPEPRLMQRFDLVTQKRELSTALPVSGIPIAMEMGHASSGPLLVVHAEGSGPMANLNYEFLDATTLRSLPVKFQGFPNSRLLRARIHLRASANGQVFGCWATGQSPTGVESIVLFGNRCKSVYAHSSSCYSVPGNFGDTLHTSFGVFDTIRPESRLPSDIAGALAHLPSSLPNYTFSFDPPPTSKRLIDQQPDTKSVGFYIGGNPDAIVSVPDIPFPKSVYFNETDMTFDKQIHYVPQAKMLVVAKTGEESLYMRQVNVEQLLANMDYLYVTSGFSVAIQPGQRLKHQIEVLSKQGGVTYALQSGPQGMTVSNSGLVNWTAPRVLKSKLGVAIILVTDRTGRQKLHRLSLRVK
ncbi:MAG: serine protease [Planctomycetota bacterium]